MNYIERYWRDARLEDAIKRPPMVARFRDNNDDQWIEDFLCGVDTENNFWFSKGDIPHVFWKFCQVYDAPDPGEGWRLIDTEIEKGEVGDEFLTQSGVWLPECRHNGFEHGVPYRRRITPAVTYVPFTWEDREQLRGRWITWKHENGLMIESQIDHINQHKDGGLWFKSHDAKWLVENATFLDTGKPVGKEVTQ